MRFLAKVILPLAAIAGLVLAYGYWYSRGRADVHLRVDDYALRTAGIAYGTPHGVSLSLRDRSNQVLAVARSVEPHGYILAVHPDSAIGNCQPEGTGALTPRARDAYAACYQQYSRWSASWAARVHSADVTVGSCELRGVPVAVSRSSDWLLWWVPLPHVGGLPRQYFDFSVALDSHACKPVDTER